MDAAGRLADERQRHDGGPGEVLAGLFFVDVEQRPETPDRGKLGQRRLHVDADVAGVDRQRERLGGRQARLERAVDKQPPYLAERHLVDEVFDVDPAVAQGAAFLVGFGDLGLAGDDPLQTRLEPVFGGGERLGGHRATPRNSGAVKP
ncbi:MAG: hypothetical protein BWY91_02244 [bacterium ADurb.BinA028]|nr:MAG: hypothetical protein BWY91_02244 [bacterium ADurb.BinA028]